LTVAATPVVSLETLTHYLDSLLRLPEIPDEPNAVNGLQVANRGEVSRIVAAVDASQQTIDRVGADGPGALILVHHGLFWDGNVPVVGRRYRRLRGLIERDLALYSAHIPLDVHPELGNNIALAELFGLSVVGWFGRYLGIAPGVWGELVIHRDELKKRIDETLGVRAKLIPGGPGRTARVGIVSGGAGSMIRDAIRAGLDTYITGEGAHHTYFDAAEGGINVIYAGHYATEQLGVQRLAQHLSVRFGLPWEFHRHDTGL
jgi:dinuclear metal center YbgI/SA1388 family protein